MSGIERLTARAGRIRKQRERGVMPRARTVAECAERIEQLERRIIELEAFKNRPLVALGSALALVIAGKLAGL